MNNFFENKSSLFGDDLKQTISKDSKVQVAASIFSIYGFKALEKELKKIDSLQFIFKDPTFIKREKKNKQEKQFEINKAKFEKSVGGTAYEVKLINKMNTKAIATECAKWIEKKVTFKTNNTSQTIPNTYFNINGIDSSYSYVNTTEFSSEGFGYQKDNNLAYAITKLETAAADQFIGQFNNLWMNQDLIDVTHEVVDFVKNLYKENSPEYIYYITLYNIFNEFLEDINEDNLANEQIGFKDSKVFNTLYPFQKDAVTGLINKLETFNGCILADSVGLGKTFTALAVIKYYELRNKDVLVLCPKKLGNNWNTYRSKYKDNILSEDRFNYDVLYHTDLNRSRGESNGIDLSRIHWENYGLVVIDESHNFRNNNARKERKSRYDILLEDVIKKGINTKVLMLSATPVNNKFTDLKNQLDLAYEGKIDELNPNISSRKSPYLILREAQATFNQWSKNEGEDKTSDSLFRELNKNFEFFKLLDSVTIARSRKHIENSYNIQDIGEFPARLKPINKYSDLTSIENFVSIDDLYESLTKLNMSIYTPLEFVHTARIAKYEELYDTVTARGTTFKQTDRERSLQKLMRANMMKRLESSVESFRLTTTRLLEKIDITLNAIEKFKQNKQNNNIEAIQNIVDDEEFSEQVIGEKVKIDLADMDIISWSMQLKSDKQVLEGILTQFNLITPETDAKLQDLIELIQTKQQNPLNCANKKVIVFTSFADTAEYLYDNIQNDVKAAVITGSSNLKNNVGLRNDFETLLSNFSPLSKGNSKPTNIDILIATDCISEGQNLQDCDYLVNYDIHWNPVRIIQRFGRIDRIGSKNDTIQLVNFWPNVSLDEYINLKNRVEDRMKILNVSSTGNDNVLDSKDNDGKFRKEQLEKLKEEVLDIEDMSNTISLTDLGLNDFRMDLIEYINTNGDIKNVSSGMHSVIKAPANVTPGVIYILKNINTKLNEDNQNQIHPFYIVYVTKEKEIKHTHLQPKETLDLMRNLCKGKITPEQTAYEIFNTSTNDGKNMDSYSKLLSESINSIIDTNDQSVVDSLFTSGPIVTNNIAGLDDFELITFLVIV